MSLIRSVSRTVLVAIVIVTLAVVGGVIYGATRLGNHAKGSSSVASGPPPKVVLKVPSLHAGLMGWDQAFKVKVKNGTIRHVRLMSAGAAVPGHLINHGTAWVTQSSRLTPQTTYVAHVAVANEAGAIAKVIKEVHTKSAKHYLTAEISPGSGTVGVGQSIAVHFAEPVPTDKRKAVEEGLTVHTSPAVVGAWHWFDPYDVHWRPPAYWKPGTKVTAHMDLSHVYFGNGTWGMPGDHVVKFNIGDALISMASVPNHVMDVYDNGKLVRSVPISAGSPEYPTMGGIHATIDKTQSIIMDSATVGIPKGTPGYYYETVYWDVRISDGGAFVHAAPWSVADQGNTNVSHGCLNASPVNAEWFYYFSHVSGDIVDVDNPVRGPSATDPGTEDWNMSWKAWLAGDADPSQAALHAHQGPLTTLPFPTHVTSVTTPAKDNKVPGDNYYLPSGGADITPESSAPATTPTHSATPTHSTSPTHSAKPTSTPTATPTGSGGKKKHQ